MTAVIVLRTLLIEGVNGVGRAFASSSLSFSCSSTFALALPLRFGAGVTDAYGIGGSTDASSAVASPMSVVWVMTEIPFFSPVFVDASGNICSSSSLGGFGSFLGEIVIGNSGA